MRPLSVVLAVLLAAVGVQGSVFSVGHGGYVARDGKIWFRNILEDSDGSWNQYRSHFQCQDRGYYHLSFHGLSRRGSAVTLHLKKNNREVLAAYGDGAGYNTASNSGVFYLYRGDTVSLHVIDGRVHESSDPSRNYITLSGFKIADRTFLPPRPFHPRPGPFPRPDGPFRPDRPFFAEGAARPSGVGPAGAPEPSGGSEAGVPSVAVAPELDGEDGFTPLESEQGGP